MLWHGVRAPRAGKWFACPPTRRRSSTGEQSSTELVWLASSRLGALAVWWAHARHRTRGRGQAGRQAVSGRACADASNAWPLGCPWRARPTGRCQKAKPRNPARVSVACSRCWVLSRALHEALVLYYYTSRAGAAGFHRRPLFLFHRLSPLQEGGGRTRGWQAGAAHSTLACHR
jgi:hypothetical protein